MLNLSEIDAKPEIKYPIFWEYKVILDAKDDAPSLFCELLGEKNFEMSRSNHSTQGRYQSYKLRVLVLNENERLSIFELLKSRAKFVI